MLKTFKSLRILSLKRTAFLQDQMDQQKTIEKNQDEEAEFIPWSLSSNEPVVIVLPTLTQSHNLDQIKL